MFELTLEAQNPSEAEKAALTNTVSAKKSAELEIFDRALEAGRFEEAVGAVNRFCYWQKLPEKLEN